MSASTLSPSAPVQGHAHTHVLDSDSYLHLFSAAASAPHLRARPHQHPHPHPHPRPYRQSFFSRSKVPSNSLFIFTLLPLLLLSLLHPVASVQNSSLFQPISNAASAILSDGQLYIYGGIVKFAPGSEPNTGSNQFLRVDLTLNFNTTTAPWTSLPGYNTYTMIDAVPSRDGKQFIIGGNRGNNGPLSYIYDVGSASWTTAPTLPGYSSMVGYKRGNVGMALDPNTGLVYIYGGYNLMAFSNELSILDTSSSTPADMTWCLSVNQTTIPQLYEPFVLYLPALSKIIVFAGCSDYDALTGLVASCAPLTTAFLISGGASLSTLSYEVQDLSTGPTSRYEACRVVLKNGNVFMQGGRSPSTFYGDAWILDVGNWTWTPVQINGSAEAMTRAGHTCQLGPNGQILVIGGYINVGNLSFYVLPSVTVIDSISWTWTTDYKGAPLNSIWTNIIPPALSNGGNNAQSGSLSAGAKGGIGAGVAVGVLGLAVGVFFWRRASVGHHVDNQTTKSNISRQPSDVEKKQEMAATGKSDSGHYQPNDNNGNNTMRGSNYFGYTADAQQTSPTGSEPEIATPSGLSVSHHPTQYHGLTASGTPGLATLITSPPTSHPPNNNRPLTYYMLSGSSQISGMTPKTTEEVALAAALFQAEDLISSGRSNASTRTTSQNQIPTREPTVIHSTHTPAGMGSPSMYQEISIPGEPLPLEPSSSVPLSPSPSPSLSPSLSAKLSSEGSLATSIHRALTIHTPMVNTLFANGSSTERSSSPRSTPGPQSVPEHEARIERSSPGVRSHVITPRDLDPDGLYPPLTPTRSHGSYSILVGAPASHISSSANSFSAASSSLRRTPTSEARSSASGGYFGPMTSVTGGVGPSHSALSHGQNLDYSIGEQVAGERRELHGRRSNSPDTSTYQDPQMMKDLNNIAKMIEIQAMTEAKHPHAIVDVTPPPAQILLDEDDV